MKCVVISSYQHICTFKDLFDSSPVFIFPFMCLVIIQGFVPEHMSPWKAHWDHQLYKALEFQYKMGLEALNENLPEIKIDITYR